MAYSMGLPSTPNDSLGQIYLPGSRLKATRIPFTGREYGYIHNGASFFLQVHKNGDIDASTHLQTAVALLLLITVQKGFLIWSVHASRYVCANKKGKLKTRNCATNDCVFRKEQSHPLCHMFTIFTAFQDRDSKAQYLVMDSYGTVKMRRRRSSVRSMGDCRMLPWLFNIRRPPPDVYQLQTVLDLKPRPCGSSQGRGGKYMGKKRFLLRRMKMRRRRLCRRRLRHDRRRICRKRKIKDSTVHHVEMT